MLNTRNTQGTSSSLAVTQVLDVEEDIWAPKYGLKGKIDASLEVLVEERNAITRRETAHTVPFEIKTGSTFAAMEHRGQTMLYTLLMAERYGIEVPAGLLYYMQTNEITRVPASRNEIRGLLMARNEMAGYMIRRSHGQLNTKSERDGGEKQADAFLPSTIDVKHSCGRCFVADACMLYRKVFFPSSLERFRISDHSFRLWKE